MNKRKEISSEGLIKRAVQTTPCQRPSAFFTRRTMQLIRREALRRERRQERSLLAGLIVGSVLLLGLVGGVLLLYPMWWPVFPSVSPLSRFYGVMTLVVMGMFLVENRLRHRWKDQ